MYNPFAKAVEDLTESDLLETLPGKCESWTFEYKGPDKLTDGEGIAKSIASFANAYGGWLFIGIRADSCNHPQLDPLDGIPSEEGGLTERIYQMCNSNLSPAPYVACSVVELANGGSVVLVHVPQSPNPPHILMSSGKVHVRSGDTTDPIDVVQDRQKLDRLYDRARENRERVEALAAAHGKGALLIEKVRAAFLDTCAALKEPPPPVGAFAVVSCPAVEAPTMLDLDAAYEPVTDIVDRVSKEAEPYSADMLRDFTRSVYWRQWLDQYRYCTVTDRYRLFYLDSFAHIGMAKTVRSKEHPHSVASSVVKECVEHLPVLCEVAQLVYRDLGYLGMVNLVCRLSLPDRQTISPVEISAPALELTSNVAAMESRTKLHLSRLTGLHDEAPRTRRP